MTDNNNLLDSLKIKDFFIPDNNLSATLSQGKKFKKSQDDIIKKTQQKEKKYKQSIIEGFGNNYNTNYLPDSKKYINSGNLAQSKFAEFQELQRKFNATKTLYETAQAAFLLKTGRNFLTAGSPYINKNIKLLNGETDYITNEGVKKTYETTAIFNATAGKNGCSTASWTDLNSNVVPSELESGTPMVSGQSCGNEGKNVRVTSTITNPTSTYVGCYRDTWGRALPTVITGGSQIYSQATCMAAAADKGFKYYGLQNGTNGTSQCFVGNDLTQAEKYGISTNMNPVPIWSSNTANGQRNITRLTPAGTLTVTSPNGTVLYTSPNAPSDCVNGGQINSINATYGGNCNGKPWYVDCGGGGGWNWWFNNRATYNIPNGNATSIVEMIKNQSGNPNNFNYTAAVYSGDPAYCCAKKFDYSYKCGNVTKSGTVNAGQNINFNCTTEMSKCNFFLTLQDDGNMCIYRGTGPQDSKGSVWCSNTNGKQQSANPAWVATLGDTRKNYMSNGWWLAPGEWIGSTNGTLCLMQQSDGNLVLYTSTPVGNCTDGTDGKKYGGGWTNALYEVNRVGDPALINKIGYVDDDSNLSTYPSSMINTDGTITNNASCSKDIVNIDSIQWTNYVKSGKNMSPSTVCGLSKNIANEKATLAGLRNTLKTYSTQMIEYITYLESLNVEIAQQMGIDKTVLADNLTLYTRYNTEFNNYKDDDVHNIDGILSDSNIVIDEENYSYMVWSILAITLLLITLNVLRK